MPVTVQIIRGDARALPLKDASVDLVVTSPPYFALRSYQDGGEHYDGQVGSEATPTEFLDALIECTTEMVRVLKPSGSMFVNLGDKYASTSTPGPQSQHSTMTGGRHKGVDHILPRRIVPGAPPKSLLGIPWRYALRCIDDLGLILRAEIVWSKPNGLPESVTDRVRRAHETWFHFVRQPRYFAAVDEIRERYAPGTAERYAAGYNPTKMAAERRTVAADYAGATYSENPLGKLPGSVWEIPTQPLTVPAHLGVDHFAAFPVEWPKRLILGWCPAGVCTACGEGRRPVARAAEPPLDLAWRERQGLERDGTNGLSGSSLGTPAAARRRSITGYARACPTPDAPSTPGVVLDPFCGTGTSVLAAHALGRIGIGVDLSADYCRLAEWRTSDRGEIARVLGVEKPPKQIEGQADLFGEEAS